MMNAETTLDRATEATPATKTAARMRYLVDFFDEFDWEWNDSSEPTFDNFEEAIEACDALQAELPQGNRDFGDHYGVINLEIGMELYCSREVMAFSA